MKQALSIATLSVVFILQTAFAATHNNDKDAALLAALAAENRTPEFAARDDWRHPYETLKFFGIESDQAVMEIWPGGGWYTEILAPYLRDNGKYIAAGWDPESDVPFIKNAVTAYQQKLDSDPIYAKVEMAVLMPPTKLEPVPEGSVDLIVTFRNIHNWMPRESQGMMLAAMYRALKPGGMLGVVEHRGDPSVPQDPKAKSGYVNEAYAIEMIEAAGFVLDGKSEINANPADTKNHPEGVWTLPPTMRLKDQDRDKYMAIGESDRFTLRFKKPE